MDRNIKDLVNEAINLIKQNNRINIKTRIKYFLKNRKKCIYNYMFWPNALLINALLIKNDEDTNKVINQQLCIFEKNKNKISNFDDGLMIYYLMKYPNVVNRDISNLKDNMYRYVLDYNQQIIPYRKKYPNLIYIDNLGMITPFLCKYGVNNKDESIIEWGIMQFDFFIKNAFDENTGLPYQTFNIQTKEKSGLVGWGRSLGWILLGLSECIITLKEYPNYQNKLIEYYKKIIDILPSYMRKDGGFPWVFSNSNEHLDTSVTSMILLSLLTLEEEKIKIKGYEKIISNLINCLENNVIEGKVINCSAECKGAGNYPQEYDSYSWSVGPTLASFLLYKKLK